MNSIRCGGGRCDAFFYCTIIPIFSFDTFMWQRTFLIFFTSIFVYRFVVIFVYVCTKSLIGRRYYYGTVIFNNGHDDKKSNSHKLSKTHETNFNGIFTIQMYEVCDATKQGRAHNETKFQAHQIDFVTIHFQQYNTINSRIILNTFDVYI